MIQQRHNEPMEVICLPITNGVYAEGECDYCEDEQEVPGVVLATRNASMEYVGTASCCLCGQRYILLQGHALTTEETQSVIKYLEHYRSVMTDPHRMPSEQQPDVREAERLALKLQGKEFCPVCDGDRILDVALVYADHSKPATLKCDHCNGTGSTTLSHIPHAR